jgi:uncharacterized membrane protein
MPEETVQTGLSDDAASGLAYVTIIPAIIFLVVAPYNQKASIRFHCWQSIFLGIACIVLWPINLVLAFIPFLGWLVALLLGLSIFVIWIICVIKAFQGQKFVIPVIGPFAEKQAGV